MKLQQTNVFNLKHEIYYKSRAHIQ